MKENLISLWAVLFYCCLIVITANLNYIHHDLENIISIKENRGFTNDKGMSDLQHQGNC